MWIDSHCHLSDERFAAALPDVLLRSKGAGVTAWVLGGTHPADWQRQRELSAHEPEQFRLGFGLHPWWVSSLSISDEELDQWIEILEQKLQQNIPHALGELGLHFTQRFSHSQQERQKKYFQLQINLAKKYPHYPLILHIVRAHALSLEILRQHKPWSQGGIIHSFTGNETEAYAYLELGFSLSFSASLVHSKQDKRWLAKLPADRILLESDSPDQLLEQAETLSGAESGYNEPALWPLIAKELSPWFMQSPEDLMRLSSFNARALFWSQKI